MTNVTGENLLIEFEQELIADGKGDKTIISYTGDTKGFLQWLETKRVTFKSYTFLHYKL